MKHIFVLCLVISVGLLLGACDTTVGQAAAESAPIPTVMADNTIIAEGRLEPVHYADIAFNANGTVSEVLVSEGQQVKAGDVIARLENSESKQADVANAEEVFLQAQKAFDNAEATALGVLADAHDALRQAQNDFDNFDVPSDLRNMSLNEALAYTGTKLDEARVAFEPYKYQREQIQNDINRDNPNPNSPQAYRSTAKVLKKRLNDVWADYRKAIQWATLEATLESAKDDLAQAQKEYDLLSSGSNSGDKALAEAQYEAARANLEAARAALADVELRAPFAGTVAGVKVKSGETVTPGQVVVSIADFSGWIVKTTDLTELDVVNIAEGEPVSIILDAIPDATIKGEVQTIGQNYSEKQGDIVYEVTIKLTESLPNIRWGMTSEVKFSK